MPPFQYEPFVNPYAASMADEIARSGDAAARAAEIIGQAHARASAMKGQGWARAIENVGQLPAQITAQRQAETDRKLKEQQLSMTIEDRQMAQAQRHAQIIGRMAGVSRTAQDFITQGDEAVANGLIHPEVWQHVKERAAALGDDPAAFRAFKQPLIDFVDQFTPPIPLKEGEQLVRPSAGGGAPVVASGPPKMVGLRPGEQLVPATGGPPVASAPFAPGTGQHVVNGQVVDATGAPVGAAIPKQETPEEIALKHAQVKEIEAKLNGTMPISPKDRAELQIQRDHLTAQIEHWQNADAALDQAPTLTPEALDLTAKNFAMTGQLPPMGMGKQGATVRTNIINRSAELYKNLDLASQRAAYDANKASLSKIQASADAVNAFENTAAKNIDLFLEQAKKVADTGIPVLNTPIRWTTGQVLGSEDQSAYEASRRSAINEVAKVVSSPGLSGQLSDAARKEVESFVPQNATLGQAVRVMNVLKQEMENRRQSYADQITEIQRRIATPPGTTPPTSRDEAGAVGHQVGDVVPYNGKRYRIKAIENGHAVLEEVQP